MTRIISYILLLQLLAFLIPVNIALARTDRPIEVTPELIERLPEIGRLNPTSITGISGFKVIDIDNDGFDEIVCRCGDKIDLNTLSGQKLRRMRFPFPIRAWKVLEIDELGGYCIFVFRKLDGWARMDVYNMKKEILGSINLCEVIDRDSSGNIDFNIGVIGIKDLNYDHKKELILYIHTWYDLYPRVLLIVNLQRWKIIRKILTAGTTLDSHFEDIDMDNMPDLLISTCAPSNGAIAGDWHDDQSVLMAIRGSDGSVLWRRVIGGPLSFAEHHLIDLDGDGQQEILAAEWSEFADKEQNTSLRVFDLPDATEILRWECPDRNTLIDCFNGWGEGDSSMILVGFNDGSLVKFDADLIPSSLYHFNNEIYFIHDVDLNDDRQKEVIVGFRDGSVVILDDELRLVGRQSFNEIPVPVRTDNAEFGEFAVISDGNVYGWSVAGVEFQPLPSGFMMLLRRWGLYAGALVVLIFAVIIYIRRKIGGSVIQPDEPSSEMTINLHQLAERVLTEIEKENVRKTICSEIISLYKGKDSFDYMIFLLGDVEIYNNAGEILSSQWRGSKRKPLLCLLLKNLTQKIHREKLMDLFWRDSDPDRAYKNLRSVIHRLNSELSLPEKGRFIIVSDQCYSINPEYRIFIDAYEFERLIATGDKMQNDNHLDQATDNYLMAVRLYAGNYLANLFEPWCETYRDNLRKLFVHASKQVGHYLLEREQTESALCFFRNALLLDEYSEELCIDIMRCHAASGNKKAVDKEYRRLQKVLSEDFNSQPQPETTRIYQSLIS